MSRDRFDVLERYAPLFKAPEPSFREFLHRRERKQRNRRIVTGVVALAVAAVGIGGLARTFSSNTIPASDPRSPFLGTWFSTDVDGSAQTMQIRVPEGEAVEIEVHDEFASVCSGAPSTMTGTGRLEGSRELVIPSPVLTCDDGSELEALTPPVEEQLRNLTLVHDPEADALHDSLGVIWDRESGEDPTPKFGRSGDMWPQSTLDEVRAAQERADAGDPDYTWQVDAQLERLDYPGTWHRLYRGQVELVDRFLREVLGWEAYQQNTLLGGADFSLTDQRFLRCAPGRTNPLYPPQPDSRNRGERCAPTLDERTYESVSLDLVQPAREGPDGIWVVSDWSSATTFEQADPAVTEAQATENLEKFLAARIAGRGAEGYVDVYAEWVEPQVPLLYATTSGAPYERFEFERVDEPKWPYGGDIGFLVRLFADGDATVVEQEIRSHWDGGRSVGIQGGLALDGTTIENGRALPMPFEQFDGEVTYSSPSENPFVIGDERDPTGLIDFTDPAFFWSERMQRLRRTQGANCARGPVPADAAAFAQAVITDPNFETTAPVAARVGGVEAVAMDVALAPGGRVCGPYVTDVHQWINLLEPGKRLRLFLVDVPEGMSMRTLAITVIATEARFEEAIEEATPIIDSIEFHPR